MTKPTLSLETIHATLANLVGSVTGVYPLTEGMESQAYAFRRGREEFVLRINRDREGFLKDRFAHDRFATASLPIPNVVDVGALDADYAYGVSRLLPGTTLQDMSPDALAPVLTPTADTLAAIAASDLDGTSGFGPWDRDGQGRYDSWREFVLDIPEPNSMAGSDEDMTGVVAEHCHRYADEVRRWAAVYPGERRLVHGDFGSNNVLTDGQRITGVIDWSESMYGDPLYDVANVFFWRSWLPCMEAQARHFEGNGCLDANHRRLVRRYALRIGVMELLETPSATVAAWAMNRCDQLMAGKL